MEDARSESGESVLKGREAIESLQKLIEAIEKGDMEELTDRQALIMLRVARVLIAAIDEETTVWRSLAQAGSLVKLKKAMEKLIEQITEGKPEPDDKPLILAKEALEISTRRCDR